MKLFIPSLKKNNDCRDEVLTELKAILYRLEKGKYDGGLDADAVKTGADRLKEEISDLECCVGTGEEDIGVLYGDALGQVKTLKKSLSQPMTHRFEEAADELSYTLSLWKDVLDGAAVLGTREEVAKARESRIRRKLNAKLSELEGVKASFTENDKRLEREIAGLEKDLSEYEAAMLKEDNERRINELYRNIKAVKSKTDMLNVRHGNYSACYNLLDMIYANAREILQATDYASEEIARAKVFLDMDKLKKVVVDPDKAIAILKQMDSDIKALSARTASMDSKVFGLDSGGTTVSGDALAYKEELMRKAREKQQLKNMGAPDGNNITQKTEDKNDGIL